MNRIRKFFQTFTSISTDQQLPSPERILSTAVHFLVEEFSVSRVVIFTLLKSKDSPKVTYEHRLDEVSSIIGEKFPPEASLYVKQLLNSPTPVVCKDVKSDAALSGIDLFHKWSLRSMLSMKILLDGFPLGIISLHQSDRRREWTEEEIADFASLVEDMEFILNITKPYAEMRKRFERQALVNQLGNQLAALNTVSSIFHTLVTKLRQIVKFDFATLNLIDETSGRLHNTEQARYSGDQFVFGNFLPAGYAIPGWCVANRKTLTIKNLAAAHSISVRQEWIDAGLNNCVAFPIMFNQQVCGAILFFTKSQYIFDREEVELLQLAVEHTAIAITKIRSIEKSSFIDTFSAEREELVKRISKAIGTHLESELVLQHAVNELGRFLSVSRCYIVIGNWEEPFARTLYEYRATGVNELSSSDFPMRDNPAIREAMWRGEPVGFDDLQSEAAFKNIEDFVKSHSICSVLYNLVTLQNDTQVFLCLDQCDKTRVWTQEEKALLVTISHELSIALEQAELVAQLQSQAEREAILNRITTAIRRSLDLQQILQTTVEELGKILSVDHCFIGLVGTTSTKIVVENEFCTSGVKSMKQKVIDKDMFEKNQTLLDTGKFLSLRPLAFEKETTNELVSTAYVPVRSDRGLIGVIGVGQASFERHWTKQEIGFIQGVANQVAVAVSQARLLEQTKIQAEREALLNRIFKIMSESFDQEEILQKVVAKVGEAFNVSRCIVSLYDNQLERWMDVAEEYLAEGVDSMKGKWNLIATPAQWVYKNQHIFVINNLDAYPLSEGKENLRSLKIGSMVMLPLIHVGEILGLLLLQQTGNERVWKDAELELLRSIASQLAVTIHNAHLFLKVNASQNQWQHTFESMTDGVALLLAPDKIVKANHSLLRICNCSSWQEFEKCDYLTLLGLRSFGEDYNPFEEVFNGAITIQFEVKALENRILRHNIDPIIDDRKGVSGAVLVVRDVTKERMAEQEMAQRNRELSVLNSISEEITKSLEIDQIISSAFNKTVEVMRADVGIVILLDDLQENLRPVAYYGEQKDKIFEILSRAQYRKGLLGGVSEKKETFVVEAISDTSIDPLFFQVASLLGLKSALFTNIQSKNRVLGLMMIAYSNSHCFNDQELQLVTAIGRQVGVAIENASLISSLQTALQKLREANRLKDEFLATLSHELRTPLTSITGWAEILSDRSDKDEEIESGLKAILSNSETLQQLINDLLELSRIENRVLKLELEPTNVNTIVDLAIQTVKQMADNRAIKIYREFAEELPDVTADGGRLQQVFWNLLSNSIKFSSRNSSVYVKTSFLDGVVEVKVKDNGIGIEPHFLPFVFERFRQADSSSTRRYGGLGIGLSLVKSLVEVHGGEVWAESEGKDQGSTFTVRLPVQNPSQLPADTVEELSYKEKVLIIEDLEDNLRLLSSIVEKQGYDVLTARSTEVGLRMAEHTPPKMIIFDVNMPGRNPIEVIQQVKKHTELAKVPVLAVSSFVLESERQQILNAGFDGLVTKPFRRSELVSLMQELISAQ